jgi:phage-related protein
MAWTVDVYEDADGNAPVEEFLDRLPKKQRAKLLGLIGKLKEYGPTLPFPYCSQVEGKLREVRTRFGKTRLRILYFGDANQEFALLHGVVKDTEKLEKSDILEAISRRADHNQRLVKKEKLNKSDARAKGG